MRPLTVFILSAFIIIKLPAVFNAPKNLKTLVEMEKVLERRKTFQKHA
jgi:hypothetical protein